MATQVQVPALGESVIVVASPRAGETLDETRILALCRQRLPAYMIPARIGDLTT